jgi:hypothetical protein
MNGTKYAKRLKDRAYARLDPAMMGVKHYGLLSPKRQALLLDCLECLKRQIGATWNEHLDAKKIFWFNIWPDDDEDDEPDTDAEYLTLQDRNLGKALHRWCRSLARKYCEPHAILDGYGFLINPAGSQEYQPWHIDNTTDAAVMWITISPYTEKNGFQYLSLRNDTPADVLEEVAENVDVIDYEMLTRRVKGISRHQLIAEPMSIFYVGRGTIHRGIPNTSGEHRIGFTLSYHFIKDFDKNYPYPDSGELESAISTFIPELHRYVAAK